jgi:16S rRNA processing protein RimM
MKNSISDEWIEIGTIVAPQGLYGEMRVYSDTDFPERFEVPGKRWLLRPNQTEPQPVELVTGRSVQGKNLYIIKLAGVENRNQVEELRGCKLMVHKSDRPQLGEDEYHVQDLIGLSVYMQESGEFIGTVVEIIPAGNDLLEVQLHEEDFNRRWTQTNADSTESHLRASAFISGSKSNSRKTVLIPFVKAIVPVVDLEAHRIEITPPLGLLEINS